MEKLVVLCYDFPHWKSSQGLINLWLNGFTVDLIIAAPWERLSVPKSKTNIVPPVAHFHPRTIAERIGWRYLQQPHKEITGKYGLGVVLGARILPRQVVARFDSGIINIHPGLLPHNRGLDNVKWAIINKWPQGVTAHYISERIDAGEQIWQETVPVFSNDTLVDIQSRVMAKEQELLPYALSLALNRPLPGKYQSAVPDDLDIQLPELLERYKKEVK